MLYNRYACGLPARTAALACPIPAWYERLIRAFPRVLFESCASGGRFDPGMPYYAPQGWTSDDTDAVERLKIQYGTSCCYPLSCMRSHVSVTPNHQVFRNAPCTDFESRLYLLQAKSSGNTRSKR